VTGLLPPSDEGEAAQLDRSGVVRSGKARRLTILHTADIHAQLHTHDEFFWENDRAVYRRRGGLAVLKTMLHRLRAKNPENTILIDGGDCFQGGGLAGLTQGQALIPMINNIGYDLILPGNWEVVYGKKMMLLDLGGYDAAKVCANMWHDTDDEFKGEMIFPPYWTKMLGGLKAGFVGYNDPLTPKRQSPAYSRGIRFTPPETNVAKYVRLLREQERCSLVFLVTHMGLAQQLGLAEKPEVDGVDFILGADTHERIRTPLQGKYTRVTEPGAFGSFVSRLDLVVEDGKLKEQHYQLLEVDPDRYKPDKELSALIERLEAPHKAELQRVVGSTRQPLVRYFVIETPMDNLITDALKWKFPVDVALSNGFRFCPPLVPDPRTGLAEITKDYLWNMLPVDSGVKRGDATGQQLWDWLEKELENAFAKNPARRFGGWFVRFKGMEVNFTIGNEAGKRLQRVTVGGQPLDRAKTYSIAACEREGDPDDVLCRLEGVKNPTLLGVNLHEVMEEYLGKFSPVAPVLEGRATATDAPATLLTQLQGYDYTFW
jgi:sulfur-oxidizing protein SoxB